MSYRTRMLINALAGLGCVGFSFAGMAGPTWLMTGVIWLWAGYAVSCFYRGKKEHEAEMLRLDLELDLLMDRILSVHEAQEALDEARRSLRDDG